MVSRGKGPANTRNYIVARLREDPSTFRTTARRQPQPPVRLREVSGAGPVRSCAQGPDLYVVRGLTVDRSLKARWLDDENVAIESVESPFGRMPDEGAPKSGARHGTHDNDVGHLSISKASQGFSGVTS